MLSVLKRSRHLQNVLGVSYESSSHQSLATLHYLRAQLHSNRLSAANGIGFQCLPIAGTNTLLNQINNAHSMNTNLPTLHHIQQRGYKIRFNIYSRGHNTHNANWNKKELKGIEYDTSADKTLSTEFPKRTPDRTVPDKTLKKRDDFEYLEFLKQKYQSSNTAARTQRRRRRNHSSSVDAAASQLQTSAKREFSADASVEPGSTQQRQQQQQRQRMAAAAQQMMAKEDEINPTSLSGLMVIAIGAAIFYWLYNIDNTKHAGISSFLSFFSSPPTVEDFIEKQERKPLRKIPDDWNALQVVVDHCKNAVMCLFDSNYYNSEWIWSKLFRLFYIPSPKLLPPTKQNVYTLVLDLDTVCHSTWSRKDGYERTMRPYYKEFIQRMFMSGWEVVLFGQCEDYDWMESPDMVKLDGKGFVAQYLWNKDCYYFNGHRCKDLSRLGRDLKHVIAIDIDPRSIQMQPENGIVLQRWSPDKETKQPDNSLLQLIEFLEYLAKAEVADVRQVLAAYRGKDIALEFRKRYFAAVKAQLQAQQADFDEDEEDAGEESYDEEEYEA